MCVCIVYILCAGLTHSYEMRRLVTLWQRQQLTAVSVNMRDAVLPYKAERLLRGEKHSEREQRATSRQTKSTESEDEEERRD